MREVGRRTKCVDMEFINMRMVLAIRDSGKIINIMEEDNMSFQMALCMRETGNAI